MEENMKNFKKAALILISYGLAFVFFVLPIVPQPLVSWAG
jgi:hypothetical protein